MKLKLILFCLLSYGFLNAQNCDYSSNVNDSIGSYRSTKDYLMSEKNVQMALRSKQASATSDIENSILGIFADIAVMEETPSEQQTTIDLSNFTLNLKNQDRVIHSKSLSLAASLLLENENVAVEQLFNKAISGLEYDHFLNAHQI